MSSDQTREQIFKPLDKKSYQQRCESIVPSVFLTFISIIQGVALGLLAQHLFTFSDASNNHFGQLLGRAPYAYSTLLSMIIVTYEYNVLTLINRYSYQLTDTVIIFVLGLFQIGPIFFLNESAWWWVTNIFFCGAGVIAFKNESSRNTESAFGINGIYSLMMAKLRLDVRLAVLGTGWCCLAAAVLAVGAQRHQSSCTLSRLLLSEPVRSILAFSERYLYPEMLLVPMFLVQFGILYYEKKYIQRVHDKLGVVW